MKKHAASQNWLEEDALFTGASPGWWEVTHILCTQNTLMYEDELLTSTAARVEELETSLSSLHVKQSACTVMSV